MVLTETGAAASFGLINSIGHFGGFIGPYVVGRLNERTGSLSAALLLIAVCYVMAGTILGLIRTPSPISTPDSNLPAEQDRALS